MNQKGFVNMLRILLVVSVIGIGGYFIIDQRFIIDQPTSPKPVEGISSFDECAKAGYRVGESFPPQCWTPDGKRFVGEIKQGQPPTPGSITVSGEITCLPKKGAGMQPMDCAIGLKGADAQHYGLKNLFQHDPEYKFSAGGLRVEVSGTFSPEEIKGHGSNKYDVVGTIDVISIKEIGQ